MLAAISISQVAWGQAIVETIPDGPYMEPDTNGKSILILLQHPQSALLGPDALKTQRDRPLTTYQDTWARPAVWRLIGQTREGQARVAAADNDDSAQEIFDDMVTRFNFLGTTIDSVSQIDKHSNWTARIINRTDFIGSKSGKWLDERLARRLLFRSDDDGVMSVRYTYFMSPDLRQVRLVAELRLYLRAAKDPQKYSRALKRRYEFLAPAHGDGLRPWRPAEKEAFRQTIEEDFARRTEQYPHNKTAYRRERDDARVAVRRSGDNILLPDGMLEAWRLDDLHDALARAAEGMTTMMQKDLASLPADDLVDGKMLTVHRLQPDGDPTRMRAREYFRDGENTVYQTGGGNLYSLPRAK